MAKAVNCLSPVNGNPCGKCAACKAIFDGSTDIIEIAAASNSGVDSIRQLRNEVIYSPIDCKYKVYIIDEVHALSKDAFNALLKTLEEPPSHVIFILATTEYYAVPATILSRCQQFLFSKIDPEQSVQRMLEIAEKENVQLDRDAAVLIARLSDGAMRDALSILDQCVSSDSHVTEELVRKCVGVADSGYLFGIFDAAIEKTPAKALKILDELIAQGKDLSRFIEELTLHCRNLMLTKAVPGGGLAAAGNSEIKKYEAQCARLSQEEILRWAELVSDSLDGINRMKQTGQARLLAERLLIRMCSPELSGDISSFAARLGALEHKVQTLSIFGINPQNTSETDKKSEKITAEVRQEAAIPNTRPQEPTSFDKIKEEPTAPSTENKETTTFDKTAEEPTAPSAENEELTDFDKTTEEPTAPTTENEETDIPFDPPYADILQSEEPQEEQNAAQEIVEGQTIIYDIDPTKPAPRDKKEINKKITDEYLSRDNEPPIPEADDDLPDDAQPLPQWSDIVSSMTPAVRGILAGTQGFLYDGKIFVAAPPSARGLLQNGKRAWALRESAAKVMGGKFDIFLLRDKPEEAQEEDFVSPLIEKAKEMGIDVTVNDR